jgi:hypothetical protein
MYAERINNFLHSMAKSCDVYSQEASEERQRLRAVTADYRVLGRTVHRTLNVVSRKTAGAGRPHPSRVRRVGVTIKKPEMPPPEELVIRPAPFPIKNYIIPAKQLVGPRRFFRSRAAQRRREDEAAELQEYQKWPVTTTTELAPMADDMTLVLATVPQAPRAVSAFM